MVVPVDDQDLLEAVLALCVLRRDGRVAVEAEALFFPGVVGVVSRRPDRAEGVTHLAPSHRIDGAQRAGRGERRDGAGHLDLLDRVHVLAGVMGTNERHRVRELRNDRHLVIEST